MQFLQVRNFTSGMLEFNRPSVKLLQPQHDGHQSQFYPESDREQGDAQLSYRDRQFIEMFIKGRPKEETNFK